MTSPNYTIVRAGSSNAITDTSGNLWTITSGAQVAVNGTADSTTSNVIELAYVNSAVWQENSSQAWFFKTSTGGTWATGSNPLPAASIDLSPYAIDTTIIEDGQTAGSITPNSIRAMNDSLSGMAAIIQTASYTLSLSDFGTMLVMNSSSATTVTVPPNASVALAIGCVINIAQYGTGQVTVAAGAGVTLRTASTLTTRAQYSVVSLWHFNANEWVVFGDIT